MGTNLMQWLGNSIDAFKLLFIGQSTEVRELDVDLLSMQLAWCGY